MPKYRYTLKNGKSLVLEGDTQPDDSDVESAAKEAGAELALADDQQADESAPEASKSSGGSIPPGVIGSIGATLATGAPLIREGVKRTAGVVARSPFAQRIAGYLGGAAGATAAGAIGGPGLGSVGGIAGYHFVRPYARKIASAVEAAADTAMPRVAGKFAALPVGRALANKLTGRILPGIGQALMVADAGRGGYWAGQKIDEATGASEKLGNALGPLYHQLFQTDAKAIDPNDPIIQELLKRAQGPQEQ